VGGIRLALTQPYYSAAYNSTAYGRPSPNIHHIGLYIVWANKYTPYMRLVLCLLYMAVGHTVRLARYIGREELRL
jgi:hypothetical protein